MRTFEALLLSVVQSVHKQFPFLFAEVSHIEMKFGMQNHRKKSRSNCLLGMIEPSVSQTSLVFILFHNFSEMIKKLNDVKLKTKKITKKDSKIS